MPLPPTPIQSGLGNLHQHQLTARLERMSQSQLSDISRTPSEQLIRSVGRSLDRFACSFGRKFVTYIINTEHAKVEQRSYFMPFGAVSVGKCTSKHTKTTFTASAARLLVMFIKYCYSTVPQILRATHSTGREIFAIRIYEILVSVC